MPTMGCADTREAVPDVVLAPDFFDTLALSKAKNTPKTPSSDQIPVESADNCLQFSRSGAKLTLLPCGLVVGVRPGSHAGS